MLKILGFWMCYAQDFGILVRISVLCGFGGFFDIFLAISRLSRKKEPKMPFLHYFCLLEPKLLEKEPKMPIFQANRFFKKSQFAPFCAIFFGIFSVKYTENGQFSEFFTYHAPSQCILHCGPKDFSPKISHTYVCAPLTYTHVRSHVCACGLVYARILNAYVCAHMCAHS